MLTHHTASVVRHLVKLINAAHAFVTEDQCPTLQHHFSALGVLQPSFNATHNWAVGNVVHTSAVGPKASCVLVLHQCDAALPPSCSQQRYRSACCSSRGLLSHAANTGTLRSWGMDITLDTYAVRPTALLPRPLV